MATDLVVRSLQGVPVVFQHEIVPDQNCSHLECSRRNNLYVQTCTKGLRWHEHRRVGAEAAWARGPPQASFLSIGRWEDKRTVMAYAKDFQDPRVLGDLLLPWPGEGDTLEFRDLAASQVWAEVHFALERLAGERQRGLYWIRIPLLQLNGARAQPGPKVRVRRGELKDRRSKAMAAG